MRGEISTILVYALDSCFCDPAAALLSKSYPHVAAPNFSVFPEKILCLAALLNHHNIILGASKYTAELWEILAIKKLLT